MSERSPSCGESATKRRRVSSSDEKSSEITYTNNQLPPGKVRCPICNIWVSESLVNEHLDICLGRNIEDSDIPKISTMVENEAGLSVNLGGSENHIISHTEGSMKDPSNRNSFETNM